MQYDMKWLVSVIFEAFKYLRCKLDGSDHLIRQCSYTFHYTAKD